MVVGLFFIIVGGLFVFTTLKEIIGLFSYEWQLDGKDKYRILNRLKIPIICFILILLFVSFVIPRLPEGM